MIPSELPMLSSLAQSRADSNGHSSHSLSSLSPRSHEDSDNMKTEDGEAAQDLSLAASHSQIRDRDMREDESAEDERSEDQDHWALSSLAYTLYRDVVDHRT